MFNLILSECTKVTGGATAGEAIGLMCGLVLATPFWFGAILFGANGSAQGQLNANAMQFLAEKVIYSGIYVGQEIEKQIYLLNE